MRFKSWEVAVIQEEYTNGGIALTFIGFDAEPIDVEETFMIEDILMASVWVAGLENDQVAIKDYSENSGVLEWLGNNGFIDLPIKSLEGNYVFNLSEHAQVYQGNSEDDMLAVSKLLKDKAREMGLL